MHWNQKNGSNFWVDHILLGVRLHLLFHPHTFFRWRLTVSLSLSHCLPKWCYCLRAWKAKCCHTFPLLSLTLSHRMDIMAFGSGYFAKQISDSWTQLCLSSLHHNSNDNQNWLRQWLRARKQKENNCRPTIPIPHHTYAVRTLTFSLLLNEATLTRWLWWWWWWWCWRWFVAKTTGNPSQLCIHYHYIMTMIIINFESDGLCGTVAIDRAFRSASITIRLLFVFRLSLKEFENKNEKKESKQ